MTTQNYCMINGQTNVCDNVCMWDGDTQTWTPPPDYLMLVQATTPAKIWGLINGNWELVETTGQGGIGFTWDGSFLITNEPQPAPQPVATGTQDI